VPSTRDIDEATGPDDHTPPQKIDEPGQPAPARASDAVIPESEPVGEVRRTGHGWIDLSIALCAIVLSVTSLAIAVHHGRIMKRMADANARLVSANSWPLLQYFQSTRTREGERVTTWNVVNAGIGPAKIQAAELTWRGRAVRNVNEILRECCGLPEGQAVQTSSLHGTVLLAGETRTFMMLRRTDDNAAVYDRLSAASPMNEVTMRLCYCSVFDECWVSDLRTLNPEPAQACPAPKVPFDQ
jgi:hypothetical protein